MEDIERTLAAEAELVEGIESNQEYVTPIPPTNPSQVYTIRIPVQSLEALRQLAQERRIRPSAMMREWVLERLALESTLQSTKARLIISHQWRQELSSLRTTRLALSRTA